MRGALFLAVIALASASILTVPAVRPSYASSVRTFARARGVRVAMSAADADEEPSEPEELPPMHQNGFDMSELAQRIESVQERGVLEQRLEALEQAWVLVFDAETDEEAVYSMEMVEEGGAHVVLAFECATEAQRYAETLEDEAYDGTASVQPLDVAALVITSREADFRVGVVFKGDFQVEDSYTGKVVPTSLFVSAASPDRDRLSLSITIVPDSIFEGRTSEDFIDPDEEPVRCHRSTAATAPPSALPAPPPCRAACACAACTARTVHAAGIFACALLAYFRRRACAAVRAG